MIDDPRKTDLLIAMLKEALPIEAGITQYLADALMEKSPETTILKHAMSLASSTLETWEVFSAVWTLAEPKPRLCIWFP